MSEAWEELKADNDYEINVNYPHQIRRKVNKMIITEKLNQDGYVCCNLNRKKCLKHRIIAEQFIINDDPENKTQVDHKNHIRNDNHIDNLRWVSCSENNKNRTSLYNVIYEYVDKIDDEAIEITDYGKYQFEFYYYVEKEDSFYFYNGLHYRKLHININKTDEIAFVYMVDIENKRRKISLNRFKKIYGINF